MGGLPTLLLAQPLNLAHAMAGARTLPSSRSRWYLQLLNPEHTVSMLRRPKGHPDFRGSNADIAVLLRLLEYLQIPDRYIIDRNVPRDLKGCRIKTMTHPPLSPRLSSSSRWASRTLTRSARRLRPSISPFSSTWSRSSSFSLDFRVWPE